MCDVLQVLAAQTLQSRTVMEGNIFALPFLGMDVMLHVAEICGGAGGQAWEVTAESTVTIQDRGASKSSTGVGPGYARSAAQAAATAFQEEEGGPAAEAAFQAATAGIRSLGSSLSNLGGLASQVREVAYEKCRDTASNPGLRCRWTPCGSRSSLLF